jgi:hypothetical protein
MDNRFYVALVSLHTGHTRKIKLVPWRGACAQLRAQIVIRKYQFECHVKSEIEMMCQNKKY